MRQSQPSPWQQEIDELAQSMTRALIFGIALIYTMESWWAGEQLAIWKLLLFFFLAFLANLYLLPTATSAKMSFWQVFRKGLRNKGMAVVISLLLLVLLGRISPFNFPYERDISTVILLSIPVSIGADVAHIYQLYANSKTEQKKSAGSNRQKPWKFILKDIASSSGGALFVALPIAPTAEIPMLAARLGFWREMAIVLFSIFIAHMVVYGTGVGRTPPSGDNTYGAKVWPYADALMSYVVALVVCAAVLFLFGRIDIGDPLPSLLALIVVLGLPAAIGAAAGKLVL